MNPRKNLLICLLALLVSAGALSGEAALKTYEVVAMPTAEARAPSAIELRAFGRVFALELAPNESLLAGLPARQRRRLGAGDLFLKGTLAGTPGSWVRLNRIDGKFSGGFFDGRELYLVDSARGLAGPGERAAADNATIVFRLRDLELPIHVDDGGVAAEDETTGTATDYATFVGHLREVAALEGSAMLAMPMTIVSDVEFSNRHGSNTASVVFGRINFIDGIYANQLGLGIELWHHEILNANGSLTSSDAGDLLEQFGSFLNGGAGTGIPFRGLAHLFTGRNLDGSVVGIAFLAAGSGTVLCRRSAGLGVDQDLDNQTVAGLVFAHEVGHNFNARHDDNESACPDLAESDFGIMSSTIGSSQEFSSCSLPVMEQALDLVSGEPDCLLETTATDGIFADGFEP